jgi:hypothetical protein
MASTIKVDNVQNQPGTNIINKCGTTITLGASSDTIALAAGASQTGFGRTGTVDWVTTPKVTGDSPVTGVTGKGYFMNTTAGAITLNLPAGAAGSIVSVMDYAATWQTNNVTVSPNGSEKIGSVNADVTLSTEGQSVTFVYVDSTQGWLNTMDSTSNVRGATYIVATGGTPCSGAIVCTNYKTHTFTGPGTFCVSCAGCAAGSNTVDYMVIAGGAGGGGGAGPAHTGGGGGAGGYRESPGTASGCYTVSPRGAAPAVALPVSATGYPIVIGAGGAGAPNCSALGSNGACSSFSTITSTGGGGGGSPVGGAPIYIGSNGGSGGGGASESTGPSSPGGSGNTPPFNPVQGMDGGAGRNAGGSYGGGGGGGALTVGGTTLVCSPAGAGGDGATSSIDATPTARAGGGGSGGSGGGRPAGAAGPGGGGAGGGPGAGGSAGTVNLGGGAGGGGGGSGAQAGGLGGSGLVIIRYKFQ